MGGHNCAIEGRSKKICDFQYNKDVYFNIITITDETQARHGVKTKVRNGKIVRLLADPRDVKVCIDYMYVRTKEDQGRKD